TEFEGAEGPIDRVTSHVSQRTGAEILPTPPGKWGIHFAAPAAASSATVGGCIRPLVFVWTRRGCAQPEVPIQPLGNRVRTSRAFQSLRPNRTISPNVSLPDRAD